MTTNSGRPPASNEPGRSSATQQRAVAHLNDAANDFFRSHLRGSWVPDYLANCGFGPDIQARWHAGYAPATWDALTRHLRAQGHTAALIEQAGLAHRSSRGRLIDTFRDRAILPVRSLDSTVAGFIGRAPDHAAAGAPKYLNSPQTCLYDKSTLLFGLWEARELLTAGACPVIVEGPLDAIAVTIAGQGHLAGLAPCGTALTGRHITALLQLANLPATGVLVAFDADPAGRHAAVRAYHLLSPLTATVTAVAFQPGDDPAHILATQGPTALAETLTRCTRPLADVVIDNEVSKWQRWLSFPEGRINAMHAAARVVANMPPGETARQVARLASGLHLDHTVVTEAVIDELGRAATLRRATGSSTPPVWSSNAVRRSL